MRYPVLSGSAAEMILQINNHKAADLIVMGTHGRSRLRHPLLGSVAERTVQRAPASYSSRSSRRMSS